MDDIRSIGIKDKKPKSNTNYNNIDISETTLDIFVPQGSGSQYDVIQTEISLDNIVNDKYYYKSDQYDSFLYKLNYDLEDYQDYSILSVYRGGLPLGVAISHTIGKPLNIIKYCTYDGDDSEIQELYLDPTFNQEKIIIVEDIIDTYNTLEKIISKFSNSKILVISLVNNISNEKYHEFKSRGIEFIYDIAKKDYWYVFPWEIFGEKGE